MDNVVSIYQASALNRTDIPLSSKPLVSLQEHSGYISSVTFCEQSVTKSALFSTSGDSTAKLWDVELQVAASIFNPPALQPFTQH